MNGTHGMAGVAALVLALAPVTAAGEPAPNATERTGETLYRAYCVSCHGAKATGDGPLAGSLRVRPADLTRLAKRSGGEFKDEKVRRAIDGREERAGHPRSDMPMWGDALSRARDGYDPKKVREQIDEIVRYLKTQQVK
jgi:mono/diheme cytochrome c family protein